MTVEAVAAGTAAGLCIALLVPSAVPARALRRIVGRESPAEIRAEASAGRSSTTWAAVLAAVAVALVIAPPAGPLLAIVIGALLRLFIARLEPEAERRRRERLVTDTPVALDLLAACLAAGAPVPAALRSVGDGVGGPIRAELHRVVRALDLGSSPTDAWATVDAAALQPVARAFTRAAQSGATLADVVADVAVELRERVRIDRDAAARRAGIRAVAPLGLCFLPAFVLVAVVPVVAGLATTVLM